MKYLIVLSLFAGSVFAQGFIPDRVEPSYSLYRDGLPGRLVCEVLQIPADPVTGAGSIKCQLVPKGELLVCSIIPSGEIFNCKKPI